MIDFVAPGAAIESSIPGSPFYAIMGGTSMAAPHVAGAFAVLRQKSRNAPAWVLAADLRAASAAVYDSRTGLSFSRINIRGALELADTTPPSVPGQFTAHVISHRVELSWATSTDDRAVTRYVVYRRPNISAAWELAGSTAPDVTTFSQEISEGEIRHYFVAASDLYGNKGKSVVRALTMTRYGARP